MTAETATHADAESTERDETLEAGQEALAGLGELGEAQGPEVHGIAVGGLGLGLGGRQQDEHGPQCRVAPGRVGQTIARPTLRGSRGKSGLRRAGWWITSTRGNPQASATENRPPAVPRAAVTAGQGEKAV